MRRAALSSRRCAPTSATSTSATRWCSPGAEAYGDQHPRFGFPRSANDTEQLLDFFRVLKAEGFFYAREPYVLSFEVKPWADEDCEVVLAGTKRVLRRAWALLED